MNKSTSTIGLLGGTFDPVHKGHIHLARAVHNALQLREVRLIPCNQPLLRVTATANAQQRLRMVEIAIKDYPELIADDSELQRGGYSYTIDTLMAMRQYDATTPLCLIIGVDRFSHFEKWRDWQQIADLTHIIVTTRADYQFTPNLQVARLLKSRQTEDVSVLHSQPGGAICFLAITPLAVSATEIRARLQKGEDVSAQLSEGVSAYIDQNKLYR